MAYAALRLPEGVHIAGEEMDANLLLLNSHDGNGSFKAKLLIGRLFCTNQLAAAGLMLEGAKVAWSVRHTTNGLARIDQARESLKLSTEAMREFEAIAESLRKTQMTLDEFDAFLTELVPDAKSEARQDAILEQRAEIKANLRTSETIDRGERRTRWGAYNAVTEYYEHLRPLRADRRAADPVERHFFSAVVDGPATEYRERAAKLLVAGVR
jgi:phage/plasmid-like protein (TIGR03299 family)